MSIETIKDKALKELMEEENQIAVKALKVKYRELKSAEQMVVNVKREIEDLEAEIADGAFNPKAH